MVECRASAPGRGRGELGRLLKVRTKLVWTLGPIALMVLLAACGLNDPTQSTLDPKGPVAQQQKDLFLLVLVIAAVVFVIVLGGILLIAWRFRHREGQDRMPAQIHGNTRLEIGWTIAPTLVLAVVLVPTISLLWDLARDPGPDALRVTVEGRQWWWRYTYTDEDMTTSYGAQAPIEVADVLVIPADRDVWLTLTSGGSGAKDAQGEPDHAVIHSFWIPQLAGKQDAVPGRENHILFRADEPGVFQGQCAEFCGLQHGRMRARVVALAPDEWDAWVAHQKEPAAEPTDEAARRGMDVFFGSTDVGSCIDCHAVGGTDASSPVAPNLTHFADPTHSCFSGCIWETDDQAALHDWLANPDAVKLGAKMPDYGLTEEQLNDLMSYLYSLT
jgi:cytochrome c oxidase subunit 2